jgi:hypothetical protein
MRTLFLKTAVALSLVFPLVSFAADVSIQEDTPTIHTKDQFEIGVEVSERKTAFNAIEGVFTYDANKVKLLRIIPGSLISFWVTEPVVTIPGEVRFSGVIPGGFLGDSGKLFSLIFEATETGSVLFEMKGLHAYQNSATGLSSDVSASPKKITILQNEPTRTPRVLNASVENDITPPASFVVNAAKDPALFENQWFIVFQTTDKETGIDHYEVAETKFFKPKPEEWVVAKNPYVLKDQTRQSYVYVKAVDKSGNEKTSVLSPLSTSWYENYFLWIIMVIVLSLLGFLFWKRSRN